MSNRLRFAEAAERIKSSLDIIDVVQRHVILKKTGRNYSGKCPFHNDKSPSMNVSREKGIFKCFACGVGGDALTFLMKIENKTYGELIRDLAQEQGLDIEFEGKSAEASFQAKDNRQKLSELNEAANQWFQTQLQNDTGQIAQNYLAQRYEQPASREQALQRFQLGYAPAGWENLTPYLKSHFDFVQANPTLLNDAGLSGTRDNGQGQYDRFRNRFIIPIHNEKGQVVAFGGRAFSDEDKPKYLNSPETILYHKSNVLYGLYQAKEAIRQTRSAIVMEGYFDVISAHLAGIEQVVGSCGTAMTESHLKLLTRFGAETVFLAFDSDSAGIKAALSAITLIEPYLEHNQELQLKVLVVPQGKDPDEFFRVHGKTAFEGLIAEAQPYLTFKLNTAIADLDFHTPEGRIQAANRLTPILQQIQRPTTRSEYTRQFAEKIGISEEALLLEIKRLEQSRLPQLKPFASRPQNSAKKKAISKWGPTSLKRNDPLFTESVTDLRANLPPRQVTVEKNLLKLLLYSQESCQAMLQEFVQQAKPVYFDDPIHQEIYVGLQQTMNEPMAHEETNTDSAKTDPKVNGFWGTLMEKMNHLYFDKPEVLHTLADLALTAEIFGESVGLDDTKGPAWFEKLGTIVQQQLAILNQSRRVQELAALKESALQHQDNQVSLVYEFQEQFQTIFQGNQGTPNG